MEPTETTRMSSRGQVIIPKGIRKASGFEKDDLFAVAAIDKDTVALKRIDQKKLMEDFQKLRAKVNKKITETEVNAMVKTTRRSRH